MASIDGTTRASTLNTTALPDTSTDPGLVNIRSRSRPEQTVSDGTGVTGCKPSELGKCWSEPCPCLP